VALIRLNRPDAMNALNTKLLSELSEALHAADANDKVRCMVVTGSDKAFAAGADVKEMADKSFVAAYQEDLFGPACAAIAAVRKPVIAAVSGYALGGGCELAMMCDFIIAADTAKFGQPEINLGIVAGMGGTQRLTRLVGMSKAMDMHLTGRFMDAEEAERAGLVSRVVPVKKLMDEAMSAADKIAEKSQVTVKAVKESVNRAYEGTLREGLLFERRMFHMMFASEDRTEGMQAFLEKRTPQFRDQ
jgi:enoyl-CoA hydratase